MNHPKLALLGVFAISSPPTIRASKLNTKEKAILAYLAVNATKRVPRETIRRLLWPDASERKGRHSLSQSIYALNKALPSWIENDATHLALRLEPYEVDIHLAKMAAKSGDIEKLLSFLGGRFLADVPTDSDEFEDWKDSTDTTFHREIEVQAALSIQHSAESPEKTHALVVKLQATFVGSELLSEAERKIYDRLSIIPSSQGHSSGANPIQSSPFIGRVRELELLKTQLRDAQRGLGSFSIITGAPGEGKTRLLQELIKATDGRRVVTVRCYEPERHIGFNIATDLMQDLISPATLKGLPGVLAAALSELLSFDISNPAPLPMLSQAGAQRRLFEAMVSAVIIEGRKTPVLIVVDDLHWADQTSVAFLHFLSRRTKNEPIMLVGATRPHRRSYQLMKAAGVRHVAVKELTASDLKDLPIQKPESQRDVEIARLLRLTGGNAFLLSEYLKSAQTTSDKRVARHPTPSTNIKDFVREIVTTLPAAAIRVISALSVVRRPVGPAVLQSITGQEPTVFTRALEQLKAARIVGGDEKLWFRHDLIRDVVYRKISKVRRRAIHSRAAEVLRDNGEKSDALAYQYFYAGDAENAHRHALAAAGEAGEQAMANEVVHFLALAARTAQDKKERSRIRFDLANVLHRSGRYAESYKYAASALRQPAGLPEPKLARLALLQLDILNLLGRINSQEVSHQLHVLRTKYADSQTANYEYAQLRLLIRSYAFDGDAIGCSRHSQELALLARSLPSNEGALALCFAARMESWSNSWVSARAWIDEAERMIVGTDLESAADAYENIACVLYEAGEFSRALQMFNKAMDSIMRSGALHLWARAATDKQALLVDMGHFDAARKLAAEVISNWVDADPVQHLATTYGNLAILSYLLEDLEGAKKHAETSLSYATSGMLAHRLMSRALIGMVELDQGRLSVADEYAKAIESDVANMHKRFGDFSFVEIFLARSRTRHGNLTGAITALALAIEDGRERDVAGWLRMRLELARMVRKNRPLDARAIARDVKEKAAHIGAAPLEHSATSLLTRI